MFGRSLKLMLVAAAFILVAAGIATAAVTLGQSSSTTPGTIDVKGPCDEPEHANDPRCAGPQIPEDDPTAGPTPNPTPSADDDGPFDDGPFDDDDGVDNSGPSENSGPGNADDEGDDNSGPSENSGPGNADDEGDHSGQG